MEMIEVTANSVDAAISKGLAELNATPGDVMIEVLEEPNTGLFGFGAREARVRIVLIGRRKGEAPEDEVEPEAEEAEEQDRLPLAEVGEEDLDEDAIVGRQVLVELLERMQIEAQVKVHRTEDDEDDAPHWMLNVTGARINRLIGRRGETLSCLQHIVRLICSRRLERRANVIVDVAGYKTGRSNRLRGLAQRLAKQAVQQGRTITLEPMHANERRIIHLTLRGRQDVTTRSVGEGRTRKVTIVPR
ncbi:MAG: Jag N-terminal domain-containing protein [Chloroflexi bacterium]|nr:Jag N-terminal domain-containing protein [Chloroflexota bacterium]